MKILIADDDEVGRYRLEASLTKQGYDVTVTSDGEQAWEALQRHDAPALAIIDWVMPGLTGLELCRRIRASEKASYVYVVMLTAKGDKQDVVEGMNAGADDYLSKPFDLQELRARLRAGERILRLEEALRIQATRDMLTGALNRGAIFEILQRHLARSRRDRGPVSVALLDLDHFKRVNDTYGHPAGDAVLREAASRMRAPLRAYDALGRYGGEEFLLVLPACGLANAADVAERVRAAIAATPFETAAGPLEITTSIGIAAVEDGRETTVDALLHEADQALYAAKHAGRNRVNVGR